MGGLLLLVQQQQQQGKQEEGQLLLVPVAVSAGVHGGVQKQRRRFIARE